MRLARLRTPRYAVSCAVPPNLSTLLLSDRRQHRKDLPVRTLRPSVLLIVVVTCAVLTATITESHAATSGVASGGPVAAVPGQFVVTLDTSVKSTEVATRAQAV